MPTAMTVARCDCGFKDSRKQLIACRRRHGDDARVLEPALGGNDVVALTHRVRSADGANAVQPADVAFNRNWRREHTAHRLTEDVHQRRIFELCLHPRADALTVEPLLECTAQRTVRRRQDDGRVLERFGETSAKPGSQRRPCEERRPGLTDRVLLRFGLYQALRLGKPLQFHVGFGDRDCDLHRTNPLHLLDFMRNSGDAPITLLHCYPYEREAGYLAQAFNNVYLDGGLAINYLGARSAGFIGRLLEMAPFRKILYSSDGFGPAELHYLGARLWRNGIRDVLQGFVDADEWSERDAIRVVDLIAHANARRVYRL